MACDTTQATKVGAAEGLVAFLSSQLCGEKPNEGIPMPEPDQNSIDVRQAIHKSLLPENRPDCK
jgi:hypothetical protein